MAKEIYIMYSEGWLERYIHATPRVVWDLARELRGENSAQEYPDPKNVEQAIAVLRKHCGIQVYKEVIPSEK